MSKRPKPQLSKRQQFLDYRHGNGKAALAGIAFLAIAGVTIYFGLTRSSATEAVSLTQAEVLPSGQDVRLPASLFDDGHAHFYRYTTSTGREIRFFVLRSSDGVIRAAFDACDVCYRERKGYHQQGDDMVCNNCGRHFRSVDVNVLTGGCNPTPLQRTADGSQIVMRTADLDLGAAYF